LPPRDTRGRAAGDQRTRFTDRPRARIAIVLRIVAIDGTLAVQALRQVEVGRNPRVAPRRAGRAPLRFSDQERRHAEARFLLRSCERFMISVHYHPSHFGRGRAASLHHLQIEAALRRLCSVCATAPAGRAEVRWNIAKLKRLMIGHFAGEESESCFGALGIASPRLAAQVDALRADHKQMLNTIEQLWVASEGLHDCSKLAPMVRSLLDEFYVHERAEVAVMRCFMSRHLVADAG
jgi:hypothetical protein